MYAIIRQSERGSISSEGVINWDVIAEAEESN